MSAPIDPFLEAYMNFTESMCDVAMREVSGHWNSRTANEERQKIKDEFVAKINKLEGEQ